MIDREELIRAAQGRLGSIYGFGSKWNLKDGNPKSPIDCSGFVRWCWAQVGILIPDGSTEQFAACKLMSNPLPGDLGFFKKEGTDAEMHHVGMLMDDTKVIEARGKMIDFHGDDIGEHVILRPRAKWEAWKDFIGWMRPYAVLNVEAK